MTVCCHQGQRSNGEGESVCGLLMEERGALSLVMSGQKTECVWLVLRSFVLLCSKANTLLGNVCVCVCVCVYVMTVQRDAVHTHRSATSALTPPCLV